MEVYHESQRDIPIMGHYDVLVCGGGPAGVSAGISAARLGAKTLIIEQFNCLGGVATAGGHGHICLYSEWGNRTRVVGGVIYEMAQRCADASYGVVTPSSADFEVEGMKRVLEQMAGECGVGLLYHTFVADAIVEDGAITGAIIQSKDGRRVVLADRVIDCTGDGDVAARAGCGFDIGDEETGLCQPVTLMFTIGGVDWEKVRAFRSNYDMSALWKKAQQNGDMRPFQTKIMGWWWTPTRPDFVGVNFTHINNIDSLKADDLTRATIEGRQQAYETIAVYRKYVPGMEHCYMVSTPNTVGIRESRRIHGRYTLTKDDVVSARDFDDSIGYGSFFIDIHNTAGPGMDEKVWQPPAGFRYSIPYRILVAKDVDNLFVAGRCASCDHEALGSLRVMPQCGVMGEAAGTAAVQSIKDNVTPKEVDVTRLRATLKETGNIVDEAGIAAAGR